MLDLRDVLDASQAAARLEIPPEKLRTLIRSGELVATRRAGRWWIPVIEVRRLEGLRRPAGRPFSQRASWQILCLLTGTPVDLPAPRRSQLRRHLREGDVDELAGRLRHRAERHLAFAHPSAIADVVGDRRFVSSGWGAAQQVGARLLPAGDEHVEGYLCRSDLADLRREHGIVDAGEVANLVLRVHPDEVSVPQTDGVAAAPVVGLDLLESGDPRGSAVGRELFAQAVESFRGR